jgi:paraquat-inducible protein A
MTAAPMIATAARSGLLVCHACAQLQRPADGSAEMGCARCGAGLHWRKPDSLLVSWMFLAAAAALYLPANLLPVIESGSLFDPTHSDTIMSGVRFLWDGGDWFIAAIIFFASIVLPAVKLAGLSILLATTQWRSTWRPQLRAALYRTMESIGRWSMVDIFVAAVLVALVQFKTIAQVEAGPGATAFAAVVLFTMFAAMSFDPRLIWDPLDGFHE